MSPTPDRALLSVPKAAALVGVSKSVAYRFARRTGCPASSACPDADCGYAGPPGGLAGRPPGW